MRISGAESLAAVANIFVGMIEAPLLVRPYIARMTRSELFAVMTIGMATVAGSVLVAYVQMLGARLRGSSGDGEPAVGARRPVAREGDGARDRDAADRGQRRCGGRGRPPQRDRRRGEGAIAGLRLAGYVGALLIAFVALIALANDGLGGIGGLVGHRRAELPARARRASRRSLR